MELRKRGWGVESAAREVGVSRTAGNNWAYGYKTYRHGALGLAKSLGPKLGRGVTRLR